MSNAPLSKSTEQEERQSPAALNPMVDAASELQVSPAPPQPQPVERGIGWLQVGIVILMALGAGFVGGKWWENQQANKAQAPTENASAPRKVSVKLATVEATTLEEKSEFVGTLEAKRSVDIRSETEGRITQIFVESGDTVRQGEAIARLKSENVEAQLRSAQANVSRAQARLAQLKAGSRPEEIAAAQARLNQTQARLAELEAGTRAEEIAQAQARLNQAEARLADARSGSLDDEIAQARSRIEANQADLELARERTNRYNQLREQGAVSQDELEEYRQNERRLSAIVEESQRRLQQLQQSQRTQIEQLQSTVDMERQALRQLENGARPEEIAQVEAEVAEAQSELNELLNGTRPEEIDQAEAEVAQAIAQVSALEVQLQETSVIAPFTGIIGDVSGKVGDFISQGDAITTLTENQRLDLRLPIPIERKADLKIGLPVQISDPQGKLMGTGEVSFISPTVDQNSQSILAKATFNNQQGLFRDNQFVRSTVIWNERSGTVMVPVNVITFRGDQRFVFVAEGDDEDTLTAKQIQVELGLVQGDNAEVVSGLKPGQRLIVSGTQRLSDGAAIQVSKPSN
ncbi:efflux RND transporter periplasmic adaptor subunit [Limnoraphis robusta]|uniref:RND transporter n=1 Tax=Limnoraphis robusta CS-951 TaxID=1637645 RepID=A0A0F5YMJ7_9CYAN|nr:efflux RND transporter periplasmic adaptor subunit [Limnoraphis robusta]KKD39998.1 RND transporter [Limnoraphis robusta CS-951]